MMEKTYLFRIKFTGGDDSLVVKKVFTEENVYNIEWERNAYMAKVVSQGILRDITLYAPSAIYSVTFEEVD